MRREKEEAIFTTETVKMDRRDRTKTDPGFLLVEVVVKGEAKGTFWAELVADTK
jgi:hypothetical protein